jgi:hypothetical protein
MLRRPKIVLVMVVVEMLRTSGILAFPCVERVMAHPQ